MNLQEYEMAFQSLLAEISRRMGAPVRPFQMEWELEKTLERQLRPIGRIGIGSDHAVDWLSQGRPGHELSIGIQMYRLPLDDGDVQLADVCPPVDLDLPMFWAVPEKDYRRLYRVLRKLAHETRTQNVEPFLQPHDRQKLWDNTIGFLRRDHADLRRFAIPQKRGILLTGEPGNGKTMACRWLSAQCGRFGLEWDSVTWDRYDQARRDGELHELFQTSRPGIILFDDFDSALRDRENCADVRDQTAFLTEIDGINSRSGVVYIFTSNLTLEQLDPAFRRPGRIDQVIHFPKPDQTLRGQFIRGRWQPEIVSGLSVEKVVAETDSLTYAELEELRKLLVLRYLDTGQVEWKWARETFEGRCQMNRSSRRIGFKSNDKRHTERQSAGIAAESDL